MLLGLFLGRVDLLSMTVFLNEEWPKGAGSSLKNDKNGLFREV
jgi:hypothetical protein